MRALDSTLVREVWDGLCAYAPEQSEAEARAFVGRQSHLLALAEVLTREFGRDVQKTALGLLFLLIKVVEAHHEAPVPSLSRDRVARAYEGAVAWLERWDGADSRFLERSGEFPQPHLVPYLLGAFYPEGAGPPEYEAEVRGSLFLLLASAADALMNPVSSGGKEGEGEGEPSEGG